MDFELPGENHPARKSVRAWFEAHPRPSGRQLAEAGYVVPHWPKPWGLAADSELQLVIDQEMKRAGVTPPAFYRYFDDKYAIVEALAERLMGRQNATLEAWVARYRNCGLEEIASKVVELLRSMHEITGGAPEGLWVMRALRAMPKLTHIRLFSHNYVADLLTDIYMPHLPHVSRDVVRRRTRMAIPSCAAN